MPVLASLSNTRRTFHVAALAGATLTGATIFAANSSAQTTGMGTSAATATDIDAENAYRAKMTDFVKQVAERPATLPRDKIQACAIRGVAMMDAIGDIDSKPVFRPILMKVGPDYLKRLSDYASCKEMTNATIKMIGSDDEGDLYSLLMGKGAIPADANITLVGEFTPRRPPPTGVSLTPAPRAQVR